MRTQWIERFNTTIASKASKPGVWRRQEGGFVIRARVRDPRTGKDREIRRILPCATLEQAVTELKTEKQAIAAGTPNLEPVKIRFRDYAEALLQKKVKTGQIRSAASRHRWKVDLKKINAQLGDLYMSEIRRSDLLAFHEHLATLATKGTYAPVTCTTLMKILKIVVRAFARENGLPEPASGIPGFDPSLRRTYTREQPNSLRPAETQFFIAQVAQCYPQYLTMITLGFALGLRPSSLRALHKVDILWTDGGWLLNRRSHTLRQEIMERTKIGKDTEIPLTPDLLAMLRNHLDSLPEGPMRDSPLLFPNKDGKVFGPDLLWWVFKNIRSRATLDKKITPRGMRRTSKDLLRLSGASQVVAMAINGHHTEQMHNHYSTVHEVEIREVIGKTTQLMGLAPLLSPGGVKTGVRDP
jgi:integrase